jgi:hypothetical protein
MCAAMLLPTDLAVAHTLADMRHAIVGAGGVSANHAVLATATAAAMSCFIFATWKKHYRSWPLLPSDFACTGRGVRRI